MPTLKTMLAGIMNASIREATRRQWREARKVWHCTHDEWGSPKRMVVRCCPWCSLPKSEHCINCWICLGCHDLLWRGRK